jgi:hypothetical protein
MRDGFWELVRESVIVQAMITLILVATVSYIWAAGRVVPDALLNITYVVLGFWFGQKGLFARRQ